MPEPLIELLSQVFPQLNLEDIYRFAAHVRERRYPDRHVFCEEGQAGDAFYIILEGTVGVLKETEHGPRLVDRLVRGQIFGELSLLLETPRTANVVAEGPVQVVEIDNDAFAAFLKPRPEIIMALTTGVMQRILSQETRLLAQVADSTEEGMPVFLSYARRDEEFAVQLADRLKLQGFEVWLDQRRIEAGSLWDDEIQKALDRCTVMIILLSSRSVLSENVADEWHYYLDEKKPIIPVLLEECRVPYRLRRVQYVDFHMMDYESALARLVERLRSRSGGTA